MFNKLRRIHGELHEKRKKAQRQRKITKKIKESDISIMTIDETLEQLEKGKSIARFGDGEMDIILGGSIGYQVPDQELSAALKEILIQKPKQCVIGIPDAISTLSNLTQKSVEFWVNNMSMYRDKWIEFLQEIPDRDYKYGNTNLTRCYIRYKDKRRSAEWFFRLMNVWKGKNVVIVEGKQTRLGCGNDFLREAKSVRRILGPAENAFQKKNELLEYVSGNIEKSAVIILALGPTATILAFELSKLGYQALDLGHCDIEYEWFLMGTEEKVAVHGKYTNEVINGNIVSDNIVDDKYENEIIAVF